MFFVLGFVPGFILSWILKKLGLLRIPYEVELAGLDYQMHTAAQAEDAEMRGALVAATRASPAE